MPLEPIIDFEARLVSQSQVIHDSLRDGVSDIKDFYRDSVVFLTGGTGFIGKQLLEKLFRTNNSVKKVFLLMRPRNGKSTEERLIQQLQDPVFDEVRKTVFDFNDRVMPVEGDVSEIRLGISEQDWHTLATEVTVIFHVAATVRFNEPIKHAVLTNVRGTREVLNLAHKCTNLRSIVHVSTAYVHCHRRDVEEKFYECPFPPNAMIDLVEYCDEKKLDDLTATLLGKWPNSYTFTKAIAEELVRTMGAGLPVCIVRPAIVISSYREPTPGWIDKRNVFGPSGLVLGVGLGGIHVYWAGSKVRMDTVPVDFVNNLAVAAAWANAERRDQKEIKIYTLSAYRKHHSWGRVCNFFKKEAVDWVTPKAFYYCFGIITENKFMYFVLSLFIHFIPGLIADSVLVLLGNKPRAIKLYKMLFNMNILLAYFILNDWNHHDDNTVALFERLSPEERIMFNFNTASINITELMGIWVLGLRKFILKDELKDTEYAKRKQKWLLVVHCVLSIVYGYLLWKLGCFLFSLMFSLF